jgi:hypothetical protein
MTDKGKLIYKTPENPRHKLAMAYAMVLLGISPWIFLALAIMSNLDTIQIKISLELFLALGFFLMMTIMAFFKGDEALNPHFKIYSNGLTKPLSPFTMFFGSKETFIPFSKIKAFETELTGKVGQSIIYSESKRGINYTHNRNIIAYLNKTLKTHGIIRISINCPKCKKLTWGDYKCAYCKSNRW